MSRETVSFNNSNSKIAFIFACPGSHEEAQKKVLAGKTGTNLDELLKILNANFPNVYCSTNRYDYVLTNASEQIYYKGYIVNGEETKRTLPLLRDDVYQATNIERLQKELAEVDKIIAFGKHAAKAIRKCELTSKTIFSKYHLGSLGIGHIHNDICGKSIKAKDPLGTQKRLQVVASDISKE